MVRHPFIVAGLLALGLLSESAGANLLENPSFEETPCTTPCNQDQAMLPSDWVLLNISPDTYSNDGSYGLEPSAFGNFTGATAQDGIRWVAAYSALPQMFGQNLASPLISGREYTISAYLREAVREDLANPGTYQIELWDELDTSADQIILGMFEPPIDNQEAWEPRTLTFLAPAGSETHPILVFRPLGSEAGNAYPGIDNIDLVPEPTAVVLLGFGLTAVVVSRISSKRRTAHYRSGSVTTE